MRTHTVLLASTSKWRKQALKDAGLTIESAPAHLLATDADEEDFKATITHLSPENQAEAISAYKGLCVSKHIQDAWILSGDQVAAVENIHYDKPATLKEAKKCIIQLSGKIIKFHTAITLCYGGDIVWQYMETPYAKHKKHTEAEADLYLTMDNPISAAGSVLIESENAHILIEETHGTTDSFCGVPTDALKAELIKRKLMDI
jgi:septum formation protein